MKRSFWILVGVGLGICVVVAGFVSYYASSEPDGLNKVAADHGFDGAAVDSATASLPTAGYSISGIDNERLSGGLAGILGVLVMAILGFGLFWFLGRGKRASVPAGDNSDVDA